MNIVDYVLTPAFLMITLVKVNGIQALTFYFTCDLPVNFRQSIFMQNTTRLYNLEQFENQIVHTTNSDYTFFNYLQNDTLYEYSNAYSILFRTENITCDHFVKNLESINNIFDQNVALNFKNPHLVNDFVFFKNEMLGTLIHYFITPISVDLSVLFWFLNPLVNSFTEYCFEHMISLSNMLFSLITFVAISSVFFKFFVKIVVSLSSNAFVVQKIKKKVDQEVSSFEDMLAFIVFFVVFFVNNLNLYTTSELLAYNMHFSFWMLFICFYALVILLPVNLIFTIGNAVFMYIKGSDKNNAVMAYIVLDVVVILSFFLRFFLQIIRWCLFLTTYYLLHEFVFEWTYNQFVYIMYSINFSNEMHYFKTNNMLISFFVQLVRYVFEIFDTCLILTIQITAFVAVILWLFNYLFSISLDDLYEAVFEDTQTNTNASAE